MIEDYLLSCILSLYGRMSQRASLSIPQLQVVYPGPPHLPYLPPCNSALDAYMHRRNSPCQP